MAYYSGSEFVPFLIIYGISLIVLFVGSLTDLKTREVPDWLNYGLIMAGVAVNLLATIVYSEPAFIINSLVGLAIFFGIAYIMFYAGQWGGGDSKMLMGIGAMIGIDVSFHRPQFLFDFFINTLFVGAFYGLLWSIGLVIKNRKKFVKEFGKVLGKKSSILAKKASIAAAAILVTASFAMRQHYAKILIWSLALLVMLTFYIFVFVRAVEKISMYKLVEPSKLTEGDWIVKDIFHGREYIAGPKDLGIERRQIRQLVELYRKGKIRKVLVKEGIPFVPSFFIAFIVTLALGNIVGYFI